MRKLFILILLLSAAVLGYCATNQPQNIGYVTTDGPLGLYVRTLAQVNALTPDTTNQLLVCSDCKFKLCVSTGSTAAGQWVIVSSTATAALSSTSVPLQCQ